MLKHLNIRVFGLVQGVGYRFFTLREANNLGIKGFVRNEADGSVYIEAEAEPAALEEFIERLKIGPWSADVKNISVTEGPLKYYNEFRIAF